MENEYETIIIAMVVMLNENPSNIINLTLRLMQNVDVIDKDLHYVSDAMNAMKDFPISDGFKFSSIKALFFEKMLDLVNFSKYVVNVYKEHENENE